MRIMKKLIEDRCIVFMAMLMMTTAVKALLVPRLEPSSKSLPSHFGRQCELHDQQPRMAASALFASEMSLDENFGKESTAAATEGTRYEPVLDQFDLEAALFCSGLAFDAYTEPPENSSRWERGVSQKERVDIIVTL